MLWVKRILIISSVFSMIFILDHFTEDNLFRTTYSEQEVTETIDQIHNRNDILDSILNDQIGYDPIADFETLFDHEVYHLFKIYFSDKEFQSLIDDMLAYEEKYGTLKDNTYHPVDVMYVAGDEVTFIENVGFRTKGHIYSRRLPIDDEGNHQEVHFMLKFDETFDTVEGTPEYEHLKSREFANLEQLLFKFNHQGDPTHANEVFSFDLFEEIGVTVPEASFAEVQIYVDNELKLTSLYSIFEHFDEEFIRRTFQDEVIGDLYKGQWSAVLEPIYDSKLYGVRDTAKNKRPLYSKETNKDNYTYYTLVNFTYELNQDNKYKRIAFLEENFNIDSFLKSMAANVLLGNPDDYRGNGNNFYYYFDQNGYMTYLPYDYDNSMGSGWTGEPGFDKYTINSDIYEWGSFDWNEFNTPLWDYIIEHEEYQIIYEDYLEEFINRGLFSEVKYKSLVNTIDDLYGDRHNINYTKEYYIKTKTENVLADLEYYRNLRNEE